MMRPSSNRSLNSVPPSLQGQPFGGELGPGLGHGSSGEVRDRDEISLLDEPGGEDGAQEENGEAKKQYLEIK